MKNGPSIDQHVVKMKVVQALSTSVKNKIIKGEFNNDFEGVFDNESDNQYVILTCLNTEDVTADKIGMFYPPRNNRRNTMAQRFSDQFLLRDQISTYKYQWQIAIDDEDVDMGAIFGDDDDDY